MCCGCPARKLGREPKDARRCFPGHFFAPGSILGPSGIDQAWRDPPTRVLVMQTWALPLSPEHPGWKHLPADLRAVLQTAVEKAVEGWFRLKDRKPALLHALAKINEHSPKLYALAEANEGVLSLYPCNPDHPARSTFTWQSRTSSPRQPHRTS